MEIEGTKIEGTKIKGAKIKGAKIEGANSEDTQIRGPGNKTEQARSGRRENRPSRRQDRTAKYVALYGMMTALAFLLSYVETLIPISLGVPGVKLGLANLVTIVSLYLLGPRPAGVIALVRVVLTGFTFGNLSMMMYSLAGAALSLLLMAVSRKKDLFGTIGVSVIGGVGHNVGQLLVAAAVVESSSLLYYLPVLLTAGTAAGAVIGMLGGILTKRLSVWFH